MINLPLPTKLESSKSQLLFNSLKKEIKNDNGLISFSKFMDIVLYHAEFGYYTGNQEKFGIGGDFITAPMISDIFAETFLSVFNKIFSASSAQVLELGAGNAFFAKDLLLSAELSAIHIDTYYILEISQHSIKKQKTFLKSSLSSDAFKKVQWISELPEKFKGVIFANEFLDALPIDLFEIKVDGVYEKKITLDKNTLAWAYAKNYSEGLSNKFELLGKLPGYIYEYSNKLILCIEKVCNCLDTGEIFFVDYGFAIDEYFHHDRHEGTLMCHYKHFAHTNPLIFLGCQDITTHINFSQVADIAIKNKMDIDGFTSQANFLINAGIINLLNKYDPSDIFEFTKKTSAVHKLLSPAEMGDLIKVLGISKNLEGTSIGFSRNDKSFQL